MTLDSLEAVLWGQARNLNSPDPLIRRTAMDAIRVAVIACVEQAIVDSYNDHPDAIARRRKVLEEVS